MSYSCTSISPSPSRPNDRWGLHSLLTLGAQSTRLEVGNSSSFLFIPFSIFSIYVFLRQSAKTCKEKLGAFRKNLKKLPLEFGRKCQLEDVVFIVHQLHINYLNLSYLFLIFLSFYLLVLTTVYITAPNKIPVENSSDVASLTEGINMHLVIHEGQLTILISHLVAAGWLALSRIH